MGEENRGSLILFWKKLTEGDKKIKWILFLGILGIRLILISEFLPGSGKKEESKKYIEYVSANAENKAYVAQMEQRLKSLIQNIEGVGNCDVMVTLKQGTQYVYASEDKTTQDKTQDNTGTNGKKVQQKDGTEKKIVVLDDSGGSRPLVETQLEPEINGVAVVCQGGDSSRVCERVIETVTTVLGIRSNQVCVTPKNR